MINSPSIKQRLLDLTCKLHRDQDGQMIVLAAVFIFILVMALAVPVRLSVSVRQKIQAQNAVDAAAITGGIWQLRGLNVVQGMNDLVYLMDALALTGLTAGAILGPCTAVPIVGQTLVLAAGNVALAVATGSHFAAQFVISPLRDIVAHGWSVMCYVGASESARANEASKIFAASPDFLSGFLGQLAQPLTSKLPDDVFDKALPEGVSKTDNGGFMRSLISIIRGLDIYAVGFEMNLPEQGNAGTLDYMADIVGSMVKDNSIQLMWLHVERKTGADYPPLKVDPLIVKKMLIMSKPLVPMSVVANTYFLKAGTVQLYVDKLFNFTNASFLNDKERANNEIKNLKIESKPYNWDHPWYESVTENDEQIAKLPTITWLAFVRPGSLSFSGWNRMGGLGVPSGVGSGKYGELGAMAMASAKLAADPVRQVRFGGVDGFVMLVPVKLTKEKHSLSVGICH